MTEDHIRAGGWEPLALTPALARLYGYPRATRGYAKRVHDGALVVVLGRDDNGHAFALSHVAFFDPDRVVPGRLPTFTEIYAARGMLVPHDVLMGAVLEPMSYALRLRWERAQSPTVLPPAPGLPTTVKVVQIFVEAVTEDVVFGTEDVPDPPTGFPTPPVRPDPVGPVPDEYPELGELEDDDDDPDAAR